MSRTRSRVRQGGHSTELRRPVGTTDGFTEADVAAANDAIAHGREVVVRTRARSVPTLLLTGVVLLVLGSVLLGTPNDNRLGAIPLLLGIALSVAALVRGGLRAAGVSPSAQLGGRRVTGSYRASRRLWSRAVREVKTGKRPESELPALHARLLEVADAETRVDRIRSRDRYEPDQGEVLAARQELAELVAGAQVLMGIPPELPAPDYRANRWAEQAELTEPEPTNPDDLR